MAHSWKLSIGRLEQKVLKFEANLMIRTSLKLTYITLARTHHQID